MKLIEIIRTRNHKDGIIGVLSIDSLPFCLTLEQPWNDNIPFKSCVPAGIYICKAITSPNFGDTFEIQNVLDGRKHCIFHLGNTVDDTQGCILLGNQIGTIRDKRAVLNSKLTINNFLNLMEDTMEFPLFISFPEAP